MDEMKKEKGEIGRLLEPYLKTMLEGDRPKLNI